MICATAVIWVGTQTVLPLFGQTAWQRDGWVFVATVIAAAVGILVESLRSFRWAQLLVPDWTASLKQWVSFYAVMLALGGLVAFI